MAADRGGFTLLELLVALGIAAIILIAATTTLFSLNQAQQQADQQMEGQRAMRNSVDLLRRELESVLFSPQDKRLRFQLQDRDFYGKPASILSFTTVAPPLEAKVSDQMIVIWQVAERDGKLRLVRGSRDYFSRDDLERPDYPLLERIDSFLVECFDGSKWVRSWDTELNRALPRRLRVTIGLPMQERVASFQFLVQPRIEPL